MTDMDDALLIDLLLHPDQRVDDLDALRRWAIFADDQLTADRLAILSHDVANGAEQINVPPHVAQHILELATARSLRLQALIKEGYVQIAQLAPHPSSTTVSLTLMGRAAILDRPS